MNFEGKFDYYTDKITEELSRISEIPNVRQKSVFEAMRYSLLAGGKRIRPILTIAVAEMRGGDFIDALKVGCSLECVHTYSLIHDDLPCMDNDDLRRGKPTCHKVFEENIALLAGDGLLNLAFEILSKSDEFKTLDSERLLKIIRMISNYSGCMGMIGGQVVDLESENKKTITLDELKYMHERKTGALIKAAVVAGAMVCDEFEENSIEYSKIIEFSSKLGLAFKIKDDILDCIGDEKVLGKPIGSDVASEKNTFVTILGIDEANKRLEKLTSEAISALEYFGEKAEFLISLAEYLLKRDK
ncbi:MAG: polyprenyl synthetase family protein [Oscillospiraceae bacterium]